jgi:hypothetical protein
MPARTNDRRASGRERGGRVRSVHATGIGLEACSSTSGEQRRRTVRAAWRGVVVGFVGHGEMGEHAGERNVGHACAAIAADDRRGSSGWAPTRCMPVSTLRWTGTPVDPPLGPPAAERVDERSACTRWPSAGSGRCRRSPSVGCSLSTRIGASIPASRNSRPSWTRATHSPLRRRRARSRDLDGAVAVAVRLDDRPERARRDRSRAGVRRCGDGVEVDVGPCPSPGIGDVRSQRLERLGIRSTMSPASRPRRRPPASGVGVHPGGCGSGAFGVTPAASSAPIIPASTSPGSGGREPLVTVIDHSDAPPGRCHHRRRALEQHRHVELVGQLAGGGDPIVAGADPVEQRELAVVRGDHGRAARGTQQRRRPVGAPRRCEDPVAVDHDRQRRLSDQRRAAAISTAPASEPGPDHQRTESVEVARHLSVEVRRQECGAG